MAVNMETLTLSQRDARAKALTDQFAESVRPVDPENPTLLERAAIAERAIDLMDEVGWIQHSFGSVYEGVCVSQAFRIVAGSGDGYSVARALFQYAKDNEDANESFRRVIRNQGPVVENVLAGRDFDPDGFHVDNVQVWTDVIVSYNDADATDYPHVKHTLRTIAKGLRKEHKRSLPWWRRPFFKV